MTHLYTALIFLSVWILNLAHILVLIWFLAPYQIFLLSWQLSANGDSFSFLMFILKTVKDWFMVSICCDTKQNQFCHTPSLLSPSPCSTFTCRCSASPERGDWGQSREARVLVLGARGAGKTALVNRWPTVMLTEQILETGIGEKPCTFQNIYLNRTGA